MCIGLGHARGKNTVFAYLRVSLYLHICSLRHRGQVDETCVVIFTIEFLTRSRAFGVKMAVHGVVVMVSSVTAGSI